MSEFGPQPPPRLPRQDIRLDFAKMRGSFRPDGRAGRRNPVTGLESFAPDEETDSEDAPQDGSYVGTDAYDLASALPNAALILGSAATGTAVPALGALALQGFGARYGAARQQGRTAGEATGDASAHALAESLPAAIPVGMLMRPGGSFLGRTLSQMGAGAAQGALTQALDEAYDKGIVGVDTSWGDAWDRIKRAGIIGGAMGAATGTTNSALRREPPAQVSWESVPSTDIAHLQGIGDLPPEKLAQYHRELSDTFTDPRTGRDELAGALGLSVRKVTEGPGYWQGKSNPSSQIELQPADPDRLALYAAGRGLIAKQDGVGWHQPVPTKRIGAINGIDFATNRPLTDEEVTAIGNALTAKYPNAAPIVTKSGIRIINHDMARTTPQDFIGDARAIVGKEIADDVVFDPSYFQSTGGLVTNDWTPSGDPHGQGFARQIRTAGSPALQRALPNILSRAGRVEARWATDHELPYTDINERILQVLGEGEKRAGGIAAN